MYEHVVWYSNETQRQGGVPRSDIAGRISLHTRAEDSRVAVFVL